MTYRSPTVVAALAALLLSSACTLGELDANQAGSSYETQSARGDVPGGVLALGASITAGVEGNSGEITAGHQEEFQDEVAEDYFDDRADTLNLAVPGATSADILRDQLPAALAFISSHPDVVITVAGGGNDLLGFQLSPEFVPCVTGNQAQCQANLSAVLTQAAQNMGQVVGALRQAAPNAIILIRDQYNALVRTGCADPGIIPLSQLAIGSLNDVLSQVAAGTGATLVVTADDFASNPDTLIGADCIHPNPEGFRSILQDFEDTFESIVPDDDDDGDDDDDDDDDR